MRRQHTTTGRGFERHYPARGTSARGSTGTLDRLELPPGRDRRILIELLDFGYPVVRVGSGARWSMFAGSSGPVSLRPRLAIAGCGAA